MQKVSVAIAGSTGLVGGELLRLLSTVPEISEIYALSRTALDNLPPRIKNVVVNFNQLEEFLPSFSAEIFICCLGTTLKTAGSPDAFRKVDYGYVLDFARCAQKSRARKFLMLSAVGADPSSPFLYSQTKGRIEQDVTKLGIPEIQIFRPSLLLGERSQPRFLEGIGQRLSFLSQYVLFGPFRKYRSIRASDVAKALVWAATHSTPGLSVHESDEIERMARKPLMFL